MTTTPPADDSVPKPISPDEIHRPITLKVFLWFFVPTVFGAISAGWYLLSMSHGLDVEIAGVSTQVRDLDRSLKDARDDLAARLEKRENVCDGLGNRVTALETASRFVPTVPTAHP
jgi:hypothetical protein